MKKYNIDKLTREEIFGGKLIAPMRQWLMQTGEYHKGYNYNDDIAIITHYIQNIGLAEENLYSEKAVPLLEKYYRATHTDLDAESLVDLTDAEALFDAIRESPVQLRFKENNAFTFVDLFAGTTGWKMCLCIGVRYLCSEKLWDESWSYSVRRYYARREQSPNS